MIEKTVATEVYMGTYGLIFNSIVNNRPPVITKIVTK